MPTLSIHNSIFDFEDYDPCDGASVVASGHDLDTALDTALLADDYVDPMNTCSYYEHVVTPFGTDELQCEWDERQERLRRWVDDDDLPF